MSSLDDIFNGTPVILPVLRLAMRIAFRAHFTGNSGAGRFSGVSFGFCGNGGRHGNNVARRRRQSNPEITADVNTLVSGMATADWVEIYHGYTAPELQAVIDKLKRQIDTPYDSQTEGSKSYQKNLVELRTRLQAATRVLRQKKGQAPAPYAVADFSGIKV
jgi:hypothetical protein